MDLRKSEDELTESTNAEAYAQEHYGCHMKDDIVSNQGALKFLHYDGN